MTTAVTSRQPRLPNRHGDAPKSRATPAHPRQGPRVHPASPRMPATTARNTAAGNGIHVTATRGNRVSAPIHGRNK
jgi:hypothetical protein